MKLPCTSPIGVFDSGAGGLSVLQAIHHLLPHENLIYVADSGYAPYGNKPQQAIIERSVAIAEFLVSRSAKALVVACNTATAAAIEELRNRYSIPVIGMEPGVKPALEHSKTGAVGVLATENTLSSQRFYALVERFKHLGKVIVQPCPGLVERIEAGEVDTAETRALLSGYLQPMREQHVDAIVLGCTHYPFLIPVLEDMTEHKVKIIETGTAVARQLQRRLLHEDHLNPDPHDGDVEFWTSGEVASVQRILQTFWKFELNVKALPEKNSVSA